MPAWRPALIAWTKCWQTSACFLIKGCLLNLYWLTCPVWSPATSNCSAYLLTHALPPTLGDACRREALASMLPAREPHAATPVLPPNAHALVVEVPARRELQQAAQVAVERMAARRCWPRVEIFGPAGVRREDGRV